MEDRLPSTPWGELPPTLRILLITGPESGCSLEQALATDSATKIEMHSAAGIVDGLSRLRHETFDAVLIVHEPHRLDALEVLDAVRTGSTEEQPILVLGTQPESELLVVCFEAGADAYLCLARTTTRMLLWHLARASERQRLLGENRRLEQGRRHAQSREQEAARRLLRQQQELAGAGAADRGLAPAPASWQAPDQLAAHYREILQAYIIMGAGNLAAETARLAELLVNAGVNATQAMSLHVQVLQSLIGELGNRSARHVMNRADMLIIEILLHLADGYHRQLLNPVAGGSWRPEMPKELAMLCE